MIRKLFLVLYHENDRAAIFATDGITINRRAEFEIFEITSGAYSLFRFLNAEPLPAKLDRRIDFRRHLPTQSVVTLVAEHK